MGERLQRDRGGGIFVIKNGGQAVKKKREGCLELQRGHVKEGK